MATAQENLARFQEIAKRGLQDRLDPDKRARFDEAVRRGLVSVDSGPQESDTEPQDDRSLYQRTMQKADAALRPAFETGPGKIAGEFMSAVNRGLINTAEFFTTDQLNAIMELSGSDKRIPGVGDSEFMKGATKGGYMDEGLGRDLVSGSGEVVPAALGGGALLRNAASRLPAATGGETARRGIVRQMGSGTARQDATLGAIAGGGSVGGGEIGEELAGEDGRMVGEALGGFLAPISASVASKTLPEMLANQVSRRMLQNAAPTVDGLKQASREIYKQIDDLGAVVNSKRVNGIVSRLTKAAENEGFNRRIHPKVHAALREFQTIRNTDQPLSKLDTLRRVAQSAASSAEPDEARLGTIMLRHIDDSMDSLNGSDFSGGHKAPVGAMYRDARQLWSRARKSELLNEAFEKARNQASGFENGLRTQFRSILNNKKRSRGFTEEELDAMRKVVRGGPVENVAKAIGKFGFSEDQAVRMLMPSLGVAGGAAIGGPAGAVAVPVIGQVSRSLSQKLTRNNAQLADDIVRAGRNGRDIVRAYLRAVPKSDRSVEDLTELLKRPGIDLAEIGKMGLTGEGKRMVSDAAYLASVLSNQTGEDQRQDSQSSP